MSTAKPKRHHYVPKMLLKRFTKDKKLWCCDYNSCKDVHERSIDNVCVECDLYTQIDRNGKKDISTEENFSKIEGLADPVVDRIIKAVEGGVPPGLTNEEKINWDHFFWNLFRRVFNKVKPVLEEDLKKNRILKNANIKSLNPQYYNKESRLRKIIEGKGLYICHIACKKQFIMGDYPILKEPSKRDLDHPDEYAWLPISPTVAVSPGGNKGEELVIPISDPKIIRNFSLAIAKQSNIIMSSCKPLIESLSQAR